MCSVGGREIRGTGVELDGHPRGTGVELKGHPRGTGVLKSVARCYLLFEERCKAVGLAVRRDSLGGRRTSFGNDLPYPCVNHVAMVKQPVRSFCEDR